MKPETGEWVDKAEADLRTAYRESGASEYPNYDAACFHAQQCAEKYLSFSVLRATHFEPQGWADCRAAHDWT